MVGLPQPEDVEDAVWRLVLANGGTFKGLYDEQGVEAGFEFDKLTDEEGGPLICRSDQDCLRHKDRLKL